MLQATSASTADDTPPVSALSPFRFPVFRSIWFASVLSNLGGLIQTVGASWMMTSIAKSADMVALVQTSVALPIVLFSLFAGAMADSLDRRQVLLGAQIFNLLVSITLTVFAWLGMISPWLLLLFTFLIGCGAAFNGPAWQASVGDMVPRSHLAGAVAINSMGFNIARSVGPAIGGAIVAGAGAAAAFAVNAASYIPLIWVLTRWRPVRPPQLLPRETLGIAIAAGLRYVSMSPGIRRVLVRGAVFGIGASSVMALLPLIARDLLGGGPMTYGLLLGAFGAGAVGGALSSARLRQRLSSEGLARVSCIAFAIAAAVSGISPYIALTVPMMVIAGAAWVLTLSTFNVTVQLSTPRWVVARALSLYQVTTFAGMAGGSWLWGVISASDGVLLAMVAAAIVMLICAAMGLRIPLSETDDLNLDPLRLWQAPETAVPVESRTGPVVITVEYNIREEDVLEFLNTMAERRRIRKRDGAMNWMLLRDLADPHVWVERFTTPTWLEYIRHNNRMTQDDANIPQRLRELHQGPGLPVVRRMIERQTGALPAGHVSTPHDLAEPLTDPSRSS
ncbi:MFS transporter [Steroidobacter sp. S1-65]|uniref:MFS transporter n=1 Tax=Steroidobacter gossypii TaxID=2805490 RepID=A0ABS1WW40_9GAMM|nr:MFS transporter [Steroidobacter gossypii]MBM0105178.1 MFS transporter [Steroidobacter gossypii]